MESQRPGRARVCLRRLYTHDVADHAARFDPFVDPAVGGDGARVSLAAGDGWRGPPARCAGGLRPILTVRARARG